MTYKTKRIGKPILKKVNYKQLKSVIPIKAKPIKNLHVSVGELTKEIMRAVKKKMIQDPNMQGMGFAECCSDCGSGSISTCPCFEIRKIIENPPAHCLVTPPIAPQS